MNSRWIVDVNMKIKLLKEDIGNIFITLEKNKHFLNRSYKASAMKKV